MIISRNWVTPITAGSFLLSAVTGALMFFHLDIGLNKLAHEWLSWVLLIGAGLHIVTNFGAFKRYFTSRLGVGLMALFALILALSFLAPVAKKEPPFMASVRALSEVPLSTLAQIAHTTPEKVRLTLASEGFQTTSDSQSVGELVGPNMKKRMHVLESILATRS